MKIDPYKHKERYLLWKKEINKKGIEGISKKNSDLIIKYTFDMEKGLNISKGSVRGPRSYSRLNSLRNRIPFFARKFKELYNLDDVTNISENQLVEFFSNLRNGTIKTEKGQNYRGISTLGKIFKAFWHWWMKINRKQGKEIQDITFDLDTRQEKPKWVYLNEDQCKRLYDNAKYKYKVLFTFLLDTGIRSPTELVNVRVDDLYNNCKELKIREEVSKTFGRRIKLMICPDLLKEYIKREELKDQDYVFPIKANSTNKYIKRLAKKLFGEGESEAGGKYSEMTLYDFRHISCCYWLPRYKSESALKYRFGWKKSDKIHYYSELLGMKDTIAEEDLLIDTTKTELEKSQEKLKRENELIKDKVINMEKTMKQMVRLLQKPSMIIENSNY